MGGGSDPGQHRDEQDRPTRPLARAELAVGESSVILLLPAPPSVGVSIWTERGCQQNDRTLADGQAERNAEQKLAHRPQHGASHSSRPANGRTAHKPSVLPGYRRESIAALFCAAGCVESVRTQSGRP